MTSWITPLRLVVAFALLLVASCSAALLLDDETTRTALGAVAGASSALLVVVLVAALGQARSQRRARDAAALGGLDPLGAARRQGR